MTTYTIDGRVVELAYDKSGYANGVYVIPNPDGACVVATNGHAIGIANIQVDGDVPVIGEALPVAVFHKTVHPNTIVVDNGVAKNQDRPLEANMPQEQSVIPSLHGFMPEVTDKHIGFSLDADLLRSLARAMHSSSAKTHPIVLWIDPDNPKKPIVVCSDDRGFDPHFAIGAIMPCNWNAECRTRYNEVRKSFNDAAKEAHDAQTRPNVVVNTPKSCKASSRTRPVTKED